MYCIVYSNRFNYNTIGKSCQNQVQNNPVKEHLKGRSQMTAHKHETKVMDHLMIFRSKLNNHLFYTLKCPHGGTAKYTQIKINQKTDSIFMSHV